MESSSHSIHTFRHTGRSSKDERPVGVSVSVSVGMSLLAAPAGGQAVREECVRHNLGCLSARSVVVRSEVWQVVRWYARLIRRATWVSLHNVPRSQPLNECVERRCRRHVFKGLSHWRIVETRSIGDDLGYLASSGVIVGAEVGQVIRRYAHFICSAARVS